MHFFVNFKIAAIQPQFYSEVEFQKSALIIVLAILKMSSMLKLVAIRPVFFSQSTLASKCDIAVYNRKPPVLTGYDLDYFLSLCAQTSAL